MSGWRTALRVLAWPLRVLLALVLLFEEWGWVPLQRAMARLGRLPLLRQAEAWLVRLPPYGALAAFVLPWAALVPVKIAALWLLGQGHAGLGLAVLIAAKVVGTAVFARLLQLVKPTLMTLGWFATLFERWTRWKDALLAWVRGSSLWQGLMVWRRWGRMLWRRLRRAE